MTYVPEGDILLNDTSLLSNSTFNLNALDRTMEYLTITNFWNLYKVQRTKLGIQRFDIPFAEFTLENRLPGQSAVKYYPKRYVYYVNYRLVPSRQRERYRRSDIYQKELNQEDISKNGNIFTHNFLLFIGNEMIHTCEVYPWEDKLAICIDVETRNNPHGIPYEKYVEHQKNNIMVSVYFVPNYNIQSFTTTVNTIGSYNNAIPVDRINTVTSLTKNTVFFCNATKDLSASSMMLNFHYDENTESILFDTDGIDSSVSDLKIWCFDFPNMDIITVNSDIHYLEMDTMMPCPTSNLLIFTKSDITSNVIYDYSVKSTLYYPNIYKFDGTAEDSSYLIFRWYNDDYITNSETYHDDLEVYRDCFDLLMKHMDGTIEDLVKNYHPSEFIYNENDYKESIYVPNVINYKVAKLREYSDHHPGILKDYWRFLGCQNEKYYLDMTLFDLSERLRTSTTPEKDDTGCDYELREESYVFNMRREFGTDKDYDFRIFVDGYFLNLTQYQIVQGLNFYYIYIPSKYIKEDSLVEVERFRYCIINHTKTVEFDEDYIEFTPPVNSIVQARDIYLYDKESSKFLLGNQYKLQHYSEYVKDWIDIPNTGAYCVSGETIRIYIKDGSLIGKSIGYGIHQVSYMETGDKYTHDKGYELGGLEYTKVDVVNYGNYSKTSYRVFNNGKFCVPAQYYVKQTGIRGDNDSIRTKCIVKEGDQFTVDHVPGTYRTVLFLKEIGENGYVDLDGKIPLPLSFRWYDMYLNGIRLNRNMVDFISETKCYIHDVGSTKNFVVMERNHDDDMFYLSSFAYKKAGYSKNILDQLFILVKEVKAEFDKMYAKIDNIDDDILEGGVLADDSLYHIIIFTEFLLNQFISANHFNSPLIESIKGEYNVYTGGVYHVSGNVNPKAKVIKRINCNEKFMGGKK